MCGFLGRIAPGQDPATLARGLGRLGRRGPDAHSIWASPGPDHAVAVLHTRLTIVDPDPRATQPLADRATGAVVAFNGEIYNYQELRQELRAYPFRTDSDTEVILAAYHLHGPAGLRRLKGMFALTVVDSRRRTVLLLRDAIGKKPLFVARWGDEVLFGSSLLAMVAVHGRPVPTAADACAEAYWRESYVPPHTSALADAAPVLPGQLLELDWSGQLVGAQTCRPEPARRYAGEPLPEVQATVRELLDAAVRRRMDGPHTPTLLLSGGIDSTVVAESVGRVAAETGRFADRQVLTLGALVPLANDERYARYAARRLGTGLTRIRPDLARLGDSVHRALDLQDEPLGMVSFFLLERLVAAAARHGRILLTGDGGDEVFLGYGQPADWRRPGPPRGAASAPDPEPRGTPGPGEAGLPDWLSPWGRRMAGPSLIGHGLAKADRASAEQAVELRCPLLDWDLVAYARSLPFEVLTHGNRAKGLLKDLLAGWPSWFVDRPKLGFTYNLRWLWALSRYAGLREGIDERAQAQFVRWLPPGLRDRPGSWRTSEVFRHFADAWRLLAWSRFLRRLDAAPRAGAAAAGLPGPGVG
jgi:asparagine synthase (glutamine-hydrolysing)